MLACMDTLAAAPTTNGCCPGCGCSEAPAAAPLPGRADLIRRAFRLEYLTLAWMLAEAGVAIASGIAAGSLLLLAFGLDSLIELASAGVLIWRLAVELKHGQAFSESAERRASRIGGALLFTLATYVVLAAIWRLLAHQAAAFSLPGLAVCVLAIPIMRLLARRKLAVAEQLRSRALRTDAMESLTCFWLSLAVVAGLAAQALVGAWWIDPLASLAIVWLLVREGREAWNGEACGCG